MSAIDVLRRFFFPCIFPVKSRGRTSGYAMPKKRLSTSLRNDLDDMPTFKSASSDPDSENSSPVSVRGSSSAMEPPRQSKTMVIGTLFGHRKGHVWFCVQQDRLAAKPLLLLELSLDTTQLIREMQTGLVRIALECPARPDLATCPLRSIPVWTMYCNGRKVGSAVRRKPNDENRLMLKTMQSMTIGAGAIPAGFGTPGSEEVMYMRATYEHVVGSLDSQSFHLINPDESGGQELSIFLLRSSR